MKVIVINKKRLGVTIIILGLMLVLFGAETKFDARLKSTALMHSNIDILKTYEGLEKKFSYKLPEQWGTSLKNFGSTEVLYHNDFISESQSLHGFVQVWNFRGDLQEFISRGLQNAYKETEYKDYAMKPVRVKNMDGYLVNYRIKDRSGNYYYRAHEYYLPKNNRLFRFSFYVRDNKYKENMTAIFKTIAETLEYVE